MAFIGIIAESKNEMQIKRVLDNCLNSRHKEHTIIMINDKNIENIKGIRFETLLITSLTEITNKKLINNLLKNSKYLVISSDINTEDIELTNSIKLNVITFGFNQKSTITASSVEEGIIICIQRRILDINKRYIEPQEIQLRIDNEIMLKNTHNSMGVAGVMLIYNKN